MPKTTDLLTAAQVAQAKGVNRRTVTRWVESGRLPVSMRLPGATGAVLFDPKVVARFVPPATTEPDLDGAA